MGLRPDLNGALFFYCLSGAEDHNKKSGSGRWKKAPKLKNKCRKKEFY